MDSVLTSMEYNIAGNVLRAYYDADGKLVFVLDETVMSSKPNVLLVINPVGDRKWDDILANDYGVDLETVRPKKNNKYQKLDIEYTGLAEYDNLIQAYKSGGDLTRALVALTEFRDVAARRAAMERLEIAEDGAVRARETIARANDTIAELQTKLKQLRATLARQKKQVGREPTKKSASKILRTDAQIDATNEKLRRAKKRLANAQRRLIIADEDAQIARDILDNVPVRGAGVVASAGAVAGGDKHRDVAVNNDGPQFTEYSVSYDNNLDDDVVQESEKNQKNDDSADGEEYQYAYDISFDENSDEYDDENDAVDVADKSGARNTVMASATSGDDAVARMSGADAGSNSDTDKSVTRPEWGVNEMPDDKDEVKPLFDKNPEILDEEIAFKPIEFGVSSPVSDSTVPGGENATSTGGGVNKEMENAGGATTSSGDDVPLTFTPPQPKSTATNAPIDVRPIADSASYADNSGYGADASAQTPGPVGDVMSAVDNVPMADATDNARGGVAPIPPAYGPDTSGVGMTNTNANTWTGATQPYGNSGENMGNVPGGAGVGAMASAPTSDARPTPPVSGGEPAPVPAGNRPASPINAGNVVGGAVASASSRRPSFVYYVMLILLIGLSVFTLWLYQKNSGDGTPDLTATAPVEDVAKDAVDTNVPVVEEDVDVATPVQVSEPEPAPVVEPEPEPEPEPVVEPEPAVVVEPEPEPVADVVIESVSVPTPVVEPEEPRIPTEEEILASKPAYNVSQNEKMFVAAPEYDTETLHNVNTNVGVAGGAVETVAADDVVDMSASVVDMSTEPTIVSESVPMAVASDLVPADSNLPMCPDGTAPDVNGCCGGEIYTDMGDLGFNCCPQSGGDCYPPLI